MLAAGDRAVEERKEEPLPEVAAAPAGPDGEGRDVGLVDHEPDSAKADENSVTTSAEIVRQAIRGEFGAVGAPWPRCVETFVFDLLHLGKVFDAQRGDLDHDVSLDGFDPRG